MIGEPLGKIGMIAGALAADSYVFAYNIEAGGGTDLITGGAGADYMRGGAGLDDYSYDTADFGTDLIEDDNGSITAMGSVTLLGVNRQGDSQNTIHLKNWPAEQLDG